MVEARREIEAGPSRARSPEKALDSDNSAPHAEGLRFATNYGDTSDWYTSRRVATRYTGFKTLVEEETGRILGAHLLGPQAEEVINLFGLAIRSGIGPGDLKHTVFAYPTGASDLSSML